MQFARLLEDEHAVSPVIGVILMVAITVILAAVIGTFVLGLGDQVQRSSPQADFAFEPYDDDADNDPDAVIITHQSGDTFQTNTLEVRAGGDRAAWTEEVSAGDDFVVADSGGANGIATDANMSIGDVTGTTFTLVYSNPDADRTATYGEYTAD